MKIADIMARDPVTVDMDDSLRHVQELFERFRFHHLLVVENGRLVGVISDRDLLRNLSPYIGRAAERPRDTATLNRRVHQIMSRTPVTVPAEMAVDDAARLMLAERVSSLPVLRADGQLAGIVTWRDLLKSCLGPLP